MRMFSIYLRRQGLDYDKDIAVVKEGFSWPGFLFFTLWAISKGMWRTAVIILIVETGILYSLNAVAVTENNLGLIIVTLTWAKGLFANDLYRMKLECQGFEIENVSVAKNGDEALISVLVDNNGIMS